MDSLFEKHECGPERTQATEIEVEGKKLRLLFGDWLPKIEVVTAVTKGDLLFVVARMRAPKDSGVDGNGAVLVARRAEDGWWEAHVWHELWEWALDYLVPESAGSGDAAAKG